MEFNRELHGSVPYVKIVKSPVRSPRPGAVPSFALRPLLLATVFRVVSLDVLVEWSVVSLSVHRLGTIALASIVCTISPR